MLFWHIWWSPVHGLLAAHSSLSRSHLSPVQPAKQTQPFSLSHVEAPCPQLQVFSQVFPYENPSHSKKKKGSGNTLLKVHFLYYILKAIFSLFLYDLFYCYYKYKKIQNGGRVLQLVLPLHVRPSLSKVWKSGHVQLYDPSTFTHWFGKEHLFKLASLHSSISEI